MGISARIHLFLLLFSVAPALHAESTADGSKNVETSANQAPTSPIESDNQTRTAEVMGLDGTHITLVVNESGQAVTVAAQEPPEDHKHKRRKHPLVGDNPADEPLVAGMTNEESPSLIEDAQPQVSNDLGK